MKCPECGNQNISYEIRGEIICRDCGLVMEDNGIEQPFISEAMQTHATQPYLIVAGSQAVEGKIFKSSWMLSTREKNFKLGIAKIDEVASRLSLPEFIITESKLIFKKSLYSNISIGRDNISLIYASIYIACSMHELPKTLMEITAYSEVESKDLMYAYRRIKRSLNIGTKLIDPLDLLSRFASKLELNINTIAIATEILIKIKGTNITAGRKPETIVAGAIYVAGQKGNNKRTQREISNTIGVIEITIRKISKEIICFIN
jgi:transcription initiation factor TFIIB